jgi:hypothetical protein
MRWHELIAAAPKATLAQYVDAIDYAVSALASIMSANGLKLTVFGQIAMEVASSLELY